MAGIEASNTTSPDNKTQLADGKRDLTIDGLSQATIQKRMAHLKVVADHLENQRFEDLVHMIQVDGNVCLVFVSLDCNAEGDYRRNALFYREI